VELITKPEPDFNEETFLREHIFPYLQASTKTLAMIYSEDGYVGKLYLDPTYYQLPIKNEDDYVLYYISSVKDDVLRECATCKKKNNSGWTVTTEQFQPVFICMGCGVYH
jgi:hypothetical protein